MEKSSKVYVGMDVHKESIEVTLIAELGDLTRFGSARQLMGYLGLVPREASSGEQRRQGSITKAGNSYARRALIEAAWAYRHPARVTRIIATRQTGLPKAACDIAWRAQLRLSARASSRFEPKERDRASANAPLHRLDKGGQPHPPQHARQETRCGRAKENP